MNNEIEKLKAQIERLRETSTILWQGRANALRDANAQRLRAEAAENQIQEIQRLNAHVEMERAFYDPNAARGGGSCAQ